MPWEDCNRCYDRPHTLFYLAPPYWETEGYGVEFGLDNYVRMAELARTIQGRMVIFVNDIPEVRKVFKGLTINQVEVGYTVGGGAQAGTKVGELVNWNQ